MPIFSSHPAPRNYVLLKAISVVACGLINQVEGWLFGCWGEDDKGGLENLAKEVATGYPLKHFFFFFRLFLFLNETLTIFYNFKRHWSDQQFEETFTMVWWFEKRKLFVSFTLWKDLWENWGNLGKDIEKWSIFHSF